MEIKKILPLFHINPDVMAHDAKYIYGVDAQAIKLFIKMLHYGVRIDGFISEEEGETLMHKPIISLSAAKKQKAAILSWEENENVDENFYAKEQIFKLSPDLSERDIVIWGVGNVGKSVIRYMASLGIPIRALIDSDQQKWGSRIGNLIVESPSVLRKLSKNIILIEALYYYHSVEDMLACEDIEIERYYQQRNIFYQDGIWVNDVELYALIEPYNVYSLEAMSENRNIWLYGSFNIAKRYADVLGLLDFNVKGYLVDAEDDFGEDGHEKILVEEIIYEQSPFVILVVDNYWERRQILRRLGLTNPEHFVPGNMIREFVHDKMQMLDINLGFTYAVSDLHPGIKVIGENKITDYKIAVLGGSTTDGYLYSIKSWPDFLYEKLKRHKDMTIYNAGKGFYTSFQELIKFIRDLLPLKPDMVLVYDGWNDIRHEKYGFLEHRYISNIFNYFSQSKNDFDLIGFKRNEISTGLPQSMEAFDKWILKIKIMNAIAGMQGIKLCVFIQPSIFTKRMLSKKEKWLALYADYTLENGENEELSDQVERFYQKARAFNVNGEYPYIYDLTNIFDETDEDIFMDYCHVFERGNEIIANEIYARICDMVPENR